MSQVTSRTVTIVRHEFEVRTPCTWKDVNDAISAALSAFAEETDGSRISDDAAMVEVRDDLVVVWWEKIQRA